MGNYTTKRAKKRLNQMEVRMMKELTAEELQLTGGTWADVTHAWNVGIKTGAAGGIVGGGIGLFAGPAGAGVGAALGGVIGLTGGVLYESGVESGFW